MSANLKGIFCLAELEIRNGSDFQGAYTEPFLTFRIGGMADSGWLVAGS